MKYSLLILLSLNLLTANAQWSSVGGGFVFGNGPLLYNVDEGRLYVGGQMRYTVQDSIPVNGICYWDHQNWHPIGGGVTYPLGVGSVGPVFTMVQHDSALYVAGGFWEMDNLPYTMQLAYWKDNMWHSMGQDSAVFCAPRRMTLLDGEVHLLGAIDTISGTVISNWAKWDGQGWLAGDVNEPFNNAGAQGWTKSLIRYQGDLYMGGNFVTNLGANDIARKTPAGWEALGPGLLGDPWVNDMVEYDGLLWVAGEFYRAWGNPSGGVMAWDGTQWLDLFPQINMISQCLDLNIIDGKLYFTGSMQVAGKPDLYRIAVYDGQQLCIIGGPDIWAGSIAGTADTLYAQMCLRTSCGPTGTQVNHIGKWPLDAPADTCFQISTGVQEEERPLDFTLFPNPNSGRFTIQCNKGASCDRSLQLQIFDPLGQLVGTHPFNAQNGNVQVEGLSAGSYSYLVRNKDGELLDRSQFILIK